MERVVQPPDDAPDDDGTNPVPTGAAPPSAEFVTSFLLHIRQRASDMAVGPAPGAATPAAPPDGAGAHMVQETCPTITGDEATYGDGAPGAPRRQEGPRGPNKRDRAAAGPGTVPGAVPDTADGNTTGITVDPALGAATLAHTVVDTSRGRERDNASISGSGDDDATGGNVFLHGDEAAAANEFDPTSVWGDGDEIAATVPEAVPTRKRQHMAATQADDTEDGATATAASADGTMEVHRSAGKRRGRRNSEARRTRKRERYDGSPSHGDHDTSASAS